MKGAWSLVGLVVWPALIALGVLIVTLGTDAVPATAPDAVAPPQKWNICWSATGPGAQALVATRGHIEVHGISDAGITFTVCAIAWPTDPKEGFSFHNPFTGCGIEVMPAPEAPEAP